MVDVQLELARPDQRDALESLFQLYVHDFSENWAGTPRGELDEHGRFAPYPLDDYWRLAHHEPFLIRTTRHLAGFVLLNQHSHLGRTVDHNVAEFFVVRKHRRRGVGLAAIDAVFQRFPGSWETAVTRQNTSAAAFWRRALAAHPRVRELQELDVATAAWNGPVLCYRVDGTKGENREHS